MTSKVCESEKFRYNCSMVTSYLDDDFCKCMPNFCVDGVLQNITVPYKIISEDLSVATFEEYQPFLLPLDRMMLRCFSNFKEFTSVEEDCDLSYYKNIRCSKDDEFVLHACYTLHTLLDRPEGEEEIVSTRASEILVLNTNPDQYNFKVKEVEMQLSIHNSKNVLNPYTYGHSLKKGHINMFRLTRTIKNLLPPPYETNCKDYLAEWKSRGGRGPTNEKECIEECQRNNSLEILGCVMHMLRGPTNERICEGIPSDERVLRAAHECSIKNCRPACYEVGYEAVKDVANFDTGGSCFDILGEYFQSLIQVEVNLDGLQTTTFTYSPKYQNIETFSYVGGYVGMWLGISLVAVFDFLETLVVILRYPFRQIVQHRARKQKVDQIRKFQRTV